MKQHWFLGILILSLFQGCGAKNSQLKDKPDEGSIFICVDETFRPVIDEQLHMYQLANPNTRILSSYKSESECVTDFLKDSSIRMAVVSRPLKPEEEQFIKSKIGYFPETNMIATDAVTVIINATSKDSLFDMNTLKEQMSGRQRTQKIFVLDGLKSTSSVRLIKEKIMDGTSFDTSVVKSARTTADVVNYVANHENAVGFVGFSWVGNMNDRLQQDTIKKISIAYLKCENCEAKPYVRPTQESLINRRYPLVRNLYYILKENYAGLGSGFSAFMKYESGQLIFRKACLSPVMDFTVRTVKIKTSQE